MPPPPESKMPPLDVGEIQQLAIDLGFALCGVADAEPTRYRQHLLDWLAAGSHGEMDWLKRNVDLRCDPGELLPGARSVICVADHIGPDTQTLDDSLGGRIARYAHFDDYHKIIKKRLHRLCDALSERAPEHTFRAAVDTAPILEREFAQRAGLGWVGKHTLLIHPSRGSHMLIGEIVTTLPLAAHSAPEPDRCGTCTRCIDACPTDCITPYAVDAARCVSYLTIEHRTAIDPAMHEAIGEWLFGCDICQDVCPYNAQDRGDVSDAPAAEYGEPRAPSFDLLAVLGWSEDDRRAAFTRSAMKRAKLPQIKRNALIVAGNRLADADAPAPGLRQRIADIADDASEDAMVRQTAQQVLDRLARGEGGR